MNKDYVTQNELNQRSARLKLKFVSAIVPAYDIPTYKWGLIKIPLIPNISNGLSITNNEFIAEEDGVYCIRTAFCCNHANTGLSRGVVLIKNESTQLQVSIEATSVITMQYVAEAVTELKAGEKLWVAFYTDDPGIIQARASSVIVERLK
jgi:hypothetical protein